MNTVEAKRIAAREIEGRRAADHFAQYGVTKESLFGLLDQYYGAYDAMRDVKLPAPGGGVTSPECAKGCTFCCHTIVALTPPEAFYVAEFIERTRTPEAFALTVEKVRADDATTRGMRGLERWGKAVPCSLLKTEDGACSAYSGRPLACRGVLSSSRRGCEAAFNERAERPLFDSPFLFQNSDIFTYAIAIGLKAAAGRRIHRLEMNAALAVIWSTERAFERWLAGEDIFAGARVGNAGEPLA